MSECEIQEYAKEKAETQRPSRSMIFRNMMKVRKEQTSTNKTVNNLPVHKRILKENPEEIR